jgi:serine/threonine protein phosphatase PrpC
MTQETHPLEPALALVHHSQTDQGDRSYNEDAFCHVRDQHVVSFAVADGMGGAAGGLRASNLAMQAIRIAPLTMDPAIFRDQLLAMSRQIREQQQAHPEYSSMSTTVVELRIDTHRQRAIWAHWGDSRIYWFRAKELMAMTSDHSVVQCLVNAGLLAPNDVATYPKKNVLLGAVGTQSEVGPEVLEQAIDISTGDAFLLCTDGIWNCLSPADIESSLQRSGCVQDWINDLMATVRQQGRGDNDNFTATGVWISNDGENTLLLHSS